MQCYIIASHTIVGSKTTNVFQFVSKVKGVIGPFFLMAASAASIIDDNMCCVLFACYLLLCWKGADSRDTKSNNILAVSLFVSVLFSKSSEIVAKPVLFLCVCEKLLSFSLPFPPINLEHSIHGE